MLRSYPLWQVMSAFDADDPFSTQIRQAQQQQQQQQKSAPTSSPLKKPPKWLRRPCGASFSVRMKNIHTYLLPSCVIRMKWTAFESLKCCCGRMHECGVQYAFSKDVLFFLLLCSLVANWYLLGRQKTHQLPRFVNNGIENILL